MRCYRFFIMATFALLVVAALCCKQTDAPGFAQDETAVENSSEVADSNADSTADEETDEEYEEDAETSFYTRTPEEYKDSIFRSTNDAQIDAFVCQMIVQEQREKGLELSDEDFADMLAAPEMKMERQKRVMQWKDEMKKEKENALKFNRRHLVTLLAGVVVILIVLACGLGKRNPQIES